jgi:single-strand DNA-binding protein
MKQTSITVVGNLATPVHRRNLGDGRSVANFRIACTESRIDRSTGAWSDGDSFFIGVTCWRDLADSVASALGKGDPVMVRGRIYTRTYDDKDGRRTSVQEIDADAVGPDLSRCRVNNLVRTTRRPAAPEEAGSPEPEQTPGSPAVPVPGEEEGAREPVPAGGG